MRERERGLESFGREALDYSCGKGFGLYHWTIGTFLMDHSSALVNRALDYSNGS